MRPCLERSKKLMIEARLWLHEWKCSQNYRNHDTKYIEVCGSNMVGTLAPQTILTLGPY